LNNQTRKKIESVIISKNGMVAVFDHQGRQIPELQGFLFEAIPKILYNCDENVKFYFVSELGTTNLNIDWWFKKVS